MPWQYRALTYYDSIGELRAASSFIARMMTRVRFYPARMNENGKTEEILSGPPVDILDRIQDPGGGRSQLQFDYGRLGFVTGEGVLFGYRLDSEDERWRYLWKEEVKRLDDGQWVRLNIDKQPTTDIGVAYRMWTPHPRHSDEADAPVRAVLDICEELLQLTASVMATARTRMTNGVYIMPLEAIPTNVEPGQDEDAEANPFLSDYIEHVSNQLENPGSAEAKVPFLYTPPYEYADRVRWIETHNPQTDYMEKDLRTEAIKRMALGLDMPPEALLGMTDANHWTAKQVQHDMWRSYGVVQAERFADGLSDAYLRPALREAGEEWTNVVVGLDDADVIISPDRAEASNQGIDRVAISRKAWRQLNGVDEDMAPDKEEEEFLTGLRLRNVDIFNELFGMEITPQRGPLPNGNGKPDASAGPAEPTAGRTGSRQESMRASAEILGAAKMALGRCRELAGSRLRSQYQHECDECKQATADKPNALVAAILGPEQVQTFGIHDPMKLVKGGADGFCDVLCASMNPTQGKALAQMVEVFAAKTLFDQAPQLPSGFVSAVEKALEVSDVIAAA